MAEAVLVTTFTPPLSNSIKSVWKVVIFILEQGGTKQTLQKKTVGFIPWDIIEKPWDFSVLFFSAPPLINYGFLYPFCFEKNNVVRLTKQVGT
jgi:hypothetical protein